MPRFVPESPSPSPSFLFPPLIILATSKSTNSPNLLELNVAPSSIGIGNVDLTLTWKSRNLWQLAPPSYCMNQSVRLHKSKRRQRQRPRSSDQAQTLNALVGILTQGTLVRAISMHVRRCSGEIRAAEYHERDAVRVVTPQNRLLLPPQCPPHMRTPQSSARWRLHPSLSLLLLLCFLAPCFAAAFIDRTKGERLTELFTFVGTRIGGRGSWIESHRKSEPKGDDRMLRRTCALHERREEQTKDIFWTLFWTRAPNQRGG